VDVIFHHGTPSLGQVYAAWEQDGVRLLGFDRSGYGESPRRPGRSVADVVEEVLAVADAHGLEQFATWGISGGGPHALACAALLPERVIACAAIGSPAPRDAAGLDWYAGYGSGNVTEFEAAERGEAALRVLVEQDEAEEESAGPAGLRDALASLTSEVDAAVLDGPLVDYLWGIIPGPPSSTAGWTTTSLSSGRGASTSARSASPC
jgi:pimeloyl-ACP methyl ester carboxylesterase